MTTERKIIVGMGAAIIGGALYIELKRRKIMNAVNEVLKEGIIEGPEKCAGSCVNPEPEISEREIKAIHEVAMGMSRAEINAFLQVIPMGLLCNEIERRTVKYAKFAETVKDAMNILG